MKLFQLEPIGLETDQVESFSSYIFRLSALHGLSPQKLLDSLIETDDVEISKSHDQLSTSCKVWALPALVRPTQTTEDIVKIVSSAVRIDGLRSTTFLAIKDLRYRATNLFSNEIRWCPLCFKEDLQSGRNRPYLRLLWHCKEVDYCHRHNVLLEQACPHCGASQNSLARRFKLHRCRKCGESLADQFTPMESNALFHEVCFRDLLLLVREIASEANLQYCPKASVAMLEKVFDNVWALDDEKEFWKLIPKDESLSIVTMNKPIRFKQLRQVAYRLGINLTGLLRGELECWTAQLDPRWLTNLPENMLPQKRGGWVDRNEIYIRLEAVVESIDPDKPPPLAHVAKIVGISTGGLEYLFPERCKTIKSNHQNWLASEKARKSYEAACSVRDYLSNSEYKHSRKHALKVIRNQTKLPKNILREVIAKEFTCVNFR